METEKAIQVIYDYAGDLLFQKKIPPSQVVSHLIERGLDKESASVVVQKLLDMRASVVKKAVNEMAQKNMLFGALWCIGGIVVTTATYSAARSGGSYVIAWGAIVFGAFQFLKGLSQYKW